MKVVLTDEARADLTEIADHIARDHPPDNPPRTLNFSKKLWAGALWLGEMPEPFPLVLQHERHGVRSRAFRNYLMFYLMELDRVIVLHILNGAQDNQALLFPPA